jgi:TrmH family RNA methyltransferase
MNKLITSAANPLIKKLRALSAKKTRDEEGLFIVEGARHVAEALEAGWEIAQLVFSQKAKTEAVVTATRKLCGVNIEVTDDILSRITGRDNTQPVIGVFKQREHALKTAQKGLWAGLEEIRDPGNLGTIIRTAAAVGAEGILLIGNTCDPWSPEAIRASMGSFSRIRIVRATQKEFIDWRPSWKGRVIGTHLHAKTDYRKADYSLPLLLMMGSEQNGLSPAVSKACDILVKIPMTEETESLNLAVSAGVMLYEVFRARF